VATFIKKSIRSLGWIIGSIAFAWIISVSIAIFFDTRMSEIPFGENAFFILWGILIIIIARPLQKFVNRQFTIRRSSAWESPEKDRNRVVSSPQFVGRLDRKKGLMEATARMVSNDVVNQTSSWSQYGEDYNLIRLRGELLDQNGSPLEYLSVEIRAKRKDWSGTIVDGDRIRVEGKFESDGVLHAESAFNFSTNSRVGSRYN
jgi:hypothetical protein